MSEYLTKETKLIYLRRDGGYVWRLMDLFNSVLAGGRASTKLAAQNAARPAKEEYEKNVLLQIEARKAKIVASFKQDAWPKDWQKRVREFKKLNELKKARRSERDGNEP